MQNNASQYLKILRTKLHKIACKMLNFSVLNHIKVASAKENPSVLNCMLQNLVYCKLVDRKIEGKNFISHSNQMSNCKQTFIYFFFTLAIFFQ